jgi:AcrR family transcriptional regulator
MPPRRYRMIVRRTARAEMRRRIVEATMALHNEQGVLATSFEDIARRADVALATVYRYFPSLSDLVEGCGALVMETTRPPAPDAAANLFEGADADAERLRRLADEFCAFYARAEKPFVAVLRDFDKVPELRQFLEGHRATLDIYVREALRPISPDEHTLRVAAALLDFPTWKALADRGLSADQIRDVVVKLLSCWVGQGRAG